MRRVVTTAVALFPVLFCSTFAPAWGLTETGEVGEVAYSIYAPAWTWQEQKINILVKAENNSAEARTFTVQLHLTADAPNAFKPPEARDDESLLVKTAELSPGEVRRVAIVNVKATSESGIGDYVLRIRLAAGGREAQVDYPVEIIRGAVVRSEKWVMLLPVIVTLAWCIVFILVLPRYAAAGAWRKSGPAIAPPGRVEDWIRET